MEKGRMLLVYERKCARASTTPYDLSLEYIKAITGTICEQSELFGIRFHILERISHISVWTAITWNSDDGLDVDLEDQFERGEECVLRLRVSLPKLRE